MKKTITLLLALAMIVSLLAACGADTRPQEPAANDGVQAAENDPSGVGDAPVGNKDAAAGLIPPFRPVISICLSPMPSS